jgi:Fe-Mn family superoxide dismutase
MAHKFPELPYAYDALEPHIDAQTMQFHHTKHHETAVDTLNKAIAGSGAEDMSVEELLANISDHSAARNSAGSHYNHSQFWQILSATGGQPFDILADAITSAFGSSESLKEKMTTAGTGHFGSGWVWLIVRDGELEVCATPNQDNPLMNVAPVRGTPIIGIDVWEHAYYLKYQNRRAEYLSNIWALINWSEAGKRYKAAIRRK